MMIIMIIIMTITIMTMTMVMMMMMMMIIMTIMIMMMAMMMTMVMMMMIIINTALTGSDFFHLCSYMAVVGGTAVVVPLVVLFPGVKCSDCDLLSSFVATDAATKARNIF